MAGKRAGNAPWKHVYGVDRKYTRRVENAKARGQYTAPKVAALTPVRKEKRDL